MLEGLLLEVVCKEELKRTITHDFMYISVGLGFFWATLYKVLLIVHHCLHNNAPTEVAAMIQYSKSERTMKLQETRALNSYGDRAFSHVGPKLWNLLPGDIREDHDLVSFKQKLKSFLMTRGEEFVDF